MVKSETIFEIIVFMIIIIIVMYISYVTFKLEFEEPRLTYNLCCDGEVCADTYYDNATNECVLTLSGERYPAANLTMI